MNYYDKINWKNRSEGKTTKISAERLNHMDNQIFNNANAIGNVEKIADIGDGTLCGAAETLKETADKLTQSLVAINSNLTQNYDLITKSKKIFTSKTDDFGIISTGIKITEAIPLFVFDGASNYACLKLHVYDNTVYATFVNTYTNAVAKQTQITVTTHYLPIK